MQRDDVKWTEPCRYMVVCLDHTAMAAAHRYDRFITRVLQLLTNALMAHSPSTNKTGG